MSRSKWDSARFRALLMRALARVHCALVVAVAYAAVLDFLQNTALSQEAAAQWSLLSPLEAYLRGLFFAVPAALSWHAAQKLPHLWQFLAASLLISALSQFLLGHPAGAVLAAVLCFFRAHARLSEEKTELLFDTLHYAFLAVFLALFLLSALASLPTTQRLSVISGVLYFLACLVYRAVARMDGYLLLNRTMYGLPARRIQRIAGAAAGALALLSALLLLPTAFRVSGDFHIDVPQLQDRPAAQPPKSDVQILDPFREFEQPLDDAFPGFRIPPFVLDILYVLAVLGVAVLLLYGLYQIFKHFRASFTDSRDVVQFLSTQDSGEALEGPGKAGKRPARWDRSPSAQVRRRYRKAVLRAAKEPPRGWQSPREIEKAAGLSVPELHALYEKARYAPTPCTREELRALKEKA